MPKYIRELEPTPDNVSQVHYQRILVWKDGKKKRDNNGKKPWYEHTAAYHIKALERHLERYKNGELKDADSGAHPLAHVVERAKMALACSMKGTRGNGNGG